jgi:hypothetical protein
MDRAMLGGLDPEGFTTIERLRIYARRGEAEFALMYPVPALVLEVTTDVLARAEGVPDRERSYARTNPADPDDVEPAQPDDVARYVGRVAFLTKRPGNPFPEMVTVGRALNNDITLVVGSVSKVHGYFRQEPGQWSFNDQRPTNGTFLNDQRLQPGQRVVLKDGDRLQLGPDMPCTFLLPASLAQRLSGRVAP